MKQGLALALLTVVITVTPTMAFAKKNIPAPLAEDQPCPVDEMIRVANAESLRRFSLLAGCDDQLVEAEAEVDAPRAPVRIVPRFIEAEYPEPAARFTSADGTAQALPATFDPAGILSTRPASYSTTFDDTIQQVAIRHSVDPLLLHAVIKQESGYRQRVRSHAGAQGLMQIMPATGATLGVHFSQLGDAEINIDAGARLLKKLYYRYAGNFTLVLAAYNAGEGAVAKYGNRVPPYAETQNYVKSVMAHYNRLVAEQGAGAATK
jgi:soluble lytic murein transglycosylase-like protein